MPSGVSDSRPLMACCTPTRSSPRMSGISSRACSIWGVEVLLGERQLGRRQRRGLDRRDVVGVHQDRPVRVRADLQVAAVLALVHVRVHVADDRVARSRRRCPRTCGTGPTSIIWWTAGVSGIEAPAIAAMRGLQMPQAMTTISASMSPSSVRTRAHPPVLDVDAGDLGRRRRPSGRPAPAPSRASACRPAANRPRRPRACRSRRG